jgi:hypothetical protein
MPADLQSDCEKVLVALKGATRLSRSDIHGRKVFNFHRAKDHLDAVGEALESSGQIVRSRIEREPGGARDRWIEVWEVNMQSHGLTNGSVPAPDDPPPGEGWLPKAKTLRQARRGVVPAVAARAGRIARKKDRATRGTTKAGTLKVSDEQRGATKLIGQAYRGYREQGIIEERDDWIRLVKNPPRRPPHHWYEALLHFLAEGHPTLDGKWRRKPKRTLVGLMEDALGRKLESSEQVRRWPGTSGSWDPADIMLIDGESRTVRTLAEVRGT